MALGCFVANMAAPWGSLMLIGVDFLLGGVANFLASYSTLYLSRRRFFKSEVLKLQLSCLASTIIITLIVGTYIPLLMDLAFGIKCPYG